MSQKIPFSNKILAFFLSFFLLITLVLSYFSLPVELVLFNPNSYYPIIEDEKYVDHYTQIIADLLYTQIFSSERINMPPLVLSDQASLTYFLTQSIPNELALETIENTFEQALDYLNFKKPSISVSININDLKASLINNADVIAGNYLNDLPTCDIDNQEDLDAQESLSIYNLPACKPKQISSLNIFKEVLTTYFQDAINGLPAILPLSRVIFLDEILTENLFKQYSLYRWALRLLPLITITILILLSVLLKRQRDVMFRWLGRLLLFISGTSLLCLVVLLIGFDQFIALSFNPFLKNFISGFDVLVLGIVQEVGYKAMVWVMISIIITAGFGIFLLLAEKFVRPKKEMNKEDNVEIKNPSEKNTDNSQYGFGEEKQIIPETMEEIEIQEKELKSKQKKSNSNKDQLIE